MKTIQFTIIGLLLLIMHNVTAQQAPMYTHYMYNTLVINPAYAGSRDALTMTAINRRQWVGFTGSPVTQSITIHSPLANEHIGLGLSMMHDKIGITNMTSFAFDYAYRFNITSNSKLSLGLSAGLNIMQADLTQLELNEQNDPAFLNDINSFLMPNIGFGAYYSGERYYAGFSIPNLLQTKYSDSNPEGNALEGREKRHFFFIAGALFKLNEYLEFKPTSLLKMTPGAPIELDLTASFVVLDRFHLGAMYRTGDAVGGLVGFDITDQFHLGYSYDWSFGLQTSLYNRGSHELVLRYDILFRNRKQIHSPRNF
jgi:type IX secretion system PorP/SprF family membrane protein